MSLNRDTVLAAVSNTDGSNFSEICRGLGADCPEKGDRSAWAELFQTISDLEREGLLEVERIDGRLETAQLTEAGANLIREKMDKRRGLLAIEGV